MIHIAKHLLLVGCGKMGGALLQAWMRDRKSQHIDSLHVVEPHAATGSVHARVHYHASLAEVPPHFQPGIVLLAVKPQSLDAVLPEYASRYGTAPLYVTIAAGKEIAYYKEKLGADARIIRAMPNTPALIGKGVTALCRGDNLLPGEYEIVKSLFAAVGETVDIGHEEQMHAVTALSGSGPAYVFLFIEALANAGIDAGLSEEAARALACETISGSALLAAQSGESLEQLRINVTSPGGTTEAALKVLFHDGAFDALVKEAATAAIKKSKELAG